MHTVSRLYTQFHPRHYDIHWDLTLAKSDRAICGKVTVSGEQLDPAHITLHAHQLDITEVRVNDTLISDFRVVADRDELIIPHHGTGDVVIAISFGLLLTDAMHGIYPCYFVHDGLKQELYATQFESHHAREAFPCIDEPEAKATFSVSLTHPPHLTALSNMPVSSHDARDHATLTHFDITPVMSTYLVAFVVGDLQRTTKTTAGGVEVNVYATKAHSHAALTYARDHAIRTIDFFDDYFGVPYPLPKSDHVALPDFSSGAMENWGLVTYREIALLADPKTASISGKQYIAEVVAHELSHQWFGNLVTMKWWDNLWLNESFASVMEYLAPAELYPEWNSWFDFTTSEGVAALRRDAIDGVQPVQVEVHHPDEITSLFDGAIVYAKGGRLLHMMQRWIGEEAFRAGLKSYFTTHQYANTAGDDLWDALGRASGKDVSGLMHTWITQSGYPVVHASLDDGTLTLRQEQFFVGPHATSRKLWPIPLDSNLPGLPELLDQRECSMPFTRNDTLYINHENTGHFIVNYDDTLRHRIISDLADGNLTDIQRAQFLHEQMMLARGGHISTASLIELLALYREETNEKVWGMMALAIGDLKKFVEHDTKAERKLRAFVGQLAATQYARLGLDVRPDDSEDDQKLRATIASCMAYSEDAAVLKTLRTRYASTAIDDLDPELRSLIIATTVKYSDGSRIVDTLVGIYRNTSSSELRSDITSGVTSTLDPKIITRLLSLIKDEHTVRTQDVIHWFVQLLGNKHGRALAWRWLRDEWHWIESVFDGDKSYDYFPRYAASLLTTRDQLGEYRAFFTPQRDNPALTRTIDMGLRDLEGRIALLERDAPAVIEVLHRL
jgi:aminopeptidase N